MSQRRIVVTGMGLVCPVGNTVDSSWQAICEGRSGIGPVTEFDASQLTTRIAGEIRDLDLSLYIDDKEARRYDKFIHYGIAASVQAMAEAGLADEAARRRSGAHRTCHWCRYRRYSQQSKIPCSYTATRDRGEYRRFIFPARLST